MWTHRGGQVIWSRKNRKGFELAAQVFGELKTENILVFDKQDSDALIEHTFFIYSFDAADFQRMPNEEFIAYQTVVPVRESKHKNAEQHLIEAGYQVEFVDELYRT